MERRQVRYEPAAQHQGKQFSTVGGLAGRKSPNCGDQRPHLSPQRHDRREPKEEIVRLNALGERSASGLREAYDTDGLKEVRPVVERGD